MPKHTYIVTIAYSSGLEMRYLREWTPAEQQMAYFRLAQHPNISWFAINLSSTRSLRGAA
jgi:hypothetical protein